MALRVGGVRQSRQDLAEVVDDIDETWALYPLVHDDGQVGSIMISPETAVAIVEQQTMGQLLPTAGDARELTRTDKALTQPLLDRFLQNFDEALIAAPTAYWTREYRCEDAVGTRHLLALQLEASEYRTFDISINFVGTDRTGELRLILPIKSQTSAAASNDSQDAEPDAERKSLKAAALQAPVELTAVMCKLRISLAELNNLAPGTVIPVPMQKPGSAKLVDKQGKTSIPVNLGQLHGMRAVRLNFPVERELDSSSMELSRALQDVSSQPLVPGFESDLSADVEQSLSETSYTAGNDLPDLDPMDLQDAEYGAQLPDIPDLPEVGETDEADIDIEISNQMADSDLDAMLADL